MRFLVLKTVVYLDGKDRNLSTKAICEHLSMWKSVFPLTALPMSFRAEAISDNYRLKQLGYMATAKSQISVSHHEFISEVQEVSEGSDLG